MGVFRRVVKPGWFVMVQAKGVQWYCGDYQTGEAAAIAADAALRYFLGSGAKTNFSGDQALSPRDLLKRNGQVKAKASVYRGVHTAGGAPGVNYPWQSCAMVNRRLIKLGTFPDEISAAKAYDAAIFGLMGERGRKRMNFPDQQPDPELVQRTLVASLQP